jgi:hypothetical protein
LTASDVHLIATGSPDGLNTIGVTVVFISSPSATNRLPVHPYLTNGSPPLGHLSDPLPPLSVGTSSSVEHSRTKLIAARSSGVSVWIPVSVDLSVGVSVGISVRVSVSVSVSVPVSVSVAVSVSVSDVVCVPVFFDSTSSESASPSSRLVAGPSGGLTT